MSGNKVISSKSLYYFYNILLLFIQIICYYLDKSDGVYVIYCCYFIFLFIQLVYYYIVGLHHDKTIFKCWVKPSNVIIFALLIVNFQTILNVFLKLDLTSSYLGTSQYDRYIGKVFILACIGMTSFLIGNTITIKCTKKTNIVHPIYRNTKLWTMLSAVCFCIWIVNIDIISFVTGMDYHGSGASTREATPFRFFETLFDVFVTINIATVTYNNILTSRSIKSIWEYCRCFPRIFIVMVCIYMLLRTLSGDRGSVLYTGLMLFFSYTISRKQSISLSKLIAIVIVGAFTMTLLNVVRGFRNPNESFSQKIERAIFSMQEDTHIKTISPLTQELANSVNCNFIAVHDIEEGVTDYKYGTYNLSELLISIPGSNKISKSLFDFDLYEHSTSEYLTRSFLGSDYLYGLGTTALADFYLDFGIFGVVLGMLIAGVLFKFIDLFVVSPYCNLVVIIAVIKFSSMSIYIPRSSFSFVMCRAIYAIILYFIFSRLFSPFIKYVKN